MNILTKKDLEKYFIHNVKQVYIEFDDGCKVSLDQISQYDLDLDNDTNSIISFTNILENRELENRFNGRQSNRIVYVQINANAVTIDDCDEFPVLYNIPCDMKIRRLNCRWKYDNYSHIRVELEGVVK